MAVALAGLVRGAKTIPAITRDIAAIAEIHPANGALSSLGAFLWFGCATILLFSAMTEKAKSEPDDFRFLMWSAALTIYLWADDFFMIHETVPWFVSSDPVTRKYIAIFILAGLAVATMFYLWAFRRRLLSLKKSYLAVALGCLGLSLAWDQLFDIGGVDLGDWGYLVEDGFKWMGIIAWLVFFTDAGLQMSVSNGQQPLSRSLMFGNGRRDERDDLIVPESVRSANAKVKTEA